MEQNKEREASHQTAMEASRSSFCAAATLIGFRRDALSRGEAGIKAQKKRCLSRSNALEGLC